MEWITYAAVAISVVVAIALIIWSVRLIATVERRGAGIAILLIGFIGAFFGFVYGAVTQMIGPSTALSGIAGALCGFAWPAAVIAALARRTQVPTVIAPEQKLATNAAAGVLRAFSVICFIAAIPAAFWVVFMIWISTGNPHGSPLLSIMSSVGIFVVPVLLGWFLWRLASR